MGIWDFSKFGLSIKSWKLVSTNPLPAPWTWELGILANLDSASKVENWFPPTPPPPQTWEFGILANLDLASIVGNWFPPPPPHPQMEISAED